MPEVVTEGGAAGRGGQKRKSEVAIVSCAGLTIGMGTGLGLRVLEEELSEEEAVTVLGLVARVDSVLPRVTA